MASVARFVAAIALSATLGAWIAATASPHLHGPPTPAHQCIGCVVRMNPAVAPEPVLAPRPGVTPLAVASLREVAPVFVDPWAVPESRGPPA